MGSTTLHGDIQSIDIFWRHGACEYNCTKLLEERLSELPQVESVTTSVKSYMASIRWNKTARFEWTPIKRAFQRVGVGIDNIRMKIEGTISPGSARIVLISTGDNTNFDLISLNKEQSNASLLAIDPKFKQEFLKYAKDRTTLIVEGSLYQPHRSPPLYLLVERITPVEEKKDEKNK